MKVLLKFDGSNKVVNQWNTDHAVAEGLFDATGRGDGPDYMGRTYDPQTDTFSPRIIPPQTRREALKEILETRPWTPAERDEAIAELF